MITQNLNPQQLQAVTFNEGPLMVVAGAGSGKTRVITSRIAYLIQECGVSPAHILAITFTNKAASEMRERVHRMLDHPESSPWISTFHSFCLRVLRRHIDSLGFSTDFAVFDGQDQLTLIKQCMKQAKVNEEAFSPKTILNHISGFKNDFQLPQDVPASSFSYGNKMKAAEVYPVYQSELKKNNALDFDDLLVTTVRLLKENAEVSQQYAERFRYILVDEFQDTNRTQYHLIRLLSRIHSNLCVVGDDDQSIYRWRGANIENILNFEKDFPDTTLIKLEENYRSTQTILKAAEAVVKENVHRKGKNLWTQNESGAPITYYRAEDETDEAVSLCERALHWNREEGYSFNDMAILYRTNAQSRVVEEELRRRNIPYKVIGGLKFYERKEIKDTLAYMRVVLNPADSVSLQRIINVPARGIGKTTLEKVKVHCADLGISLWEGLKRVPGENWTTTAASKKIAQFVTMMETLKDKIQEGPSVEFLSEVLEKTGYLAMLQKDKTVENKSRLENLKELYSAVEQFIETDQNGDFKDFLDTATLASDSDKLDDSRGVLPLMTLHTCKGLEFQVVFIIGMENGLLPHSSSMADQAEFEEERRLCYVGLTRAKKKLVVSNARRRRIYGSTYNYQPSEFLLSIPPNVLEKEMSVSTPTVPSYAGVHTQPSNSPAPAFMKPKQDDSPYSIGTKVVHPKFGKGVVVNKEGEDDDLKVVVFFQMAGKKKLAVKLAKMIVL